MTLDAVALATLLHACAARIGPRTMTAIVRVESGADPNAIYDNSSRRAYTGLERSGATGLARTLLARGDVLDLGLAQIDSVNLTRVGLNASEIFDPCANLRAGSRILGDAYRSASARFGDGQYALRRAIGAYNTGSIYGGAAYVSQVLAAAGIGPETDIDVPDLTPVVRRASAPVILRREPAKRSAGPKKRSSATVHYTPYNAPFAIGSQDGRFSAATVPLRAFGATQGLPGGLLPARAQSPIASGVGAGTLTP